MWQVFPEEIAAVKHLASAHVEEVDGQHLIFVVVTEDVGIIALDIGHTLLFVQLLYGGDQVAVFAGQLILLLLSGKFHAGAQGFGEVPVLALKKQLHILHGFGVNLGRGQLFYARPKAALDVVLQART